ncbi:hypothetical protein ACFL54_04875 [Planctomycetota bacterium]
MKRLAILTIDGIFLPIVVSLLLQLVLKITFWDLAVYFCICEILANLWVDGCSRVLIKPVRQISAPMIVPMPAMMGMYFFFPDISLDNMGFLLLNYGLYIGYSVAMIFIKPAIHLMVIGPTGALPEGES